MISILGQNLSKIREEKGISQSELAKISEVGKSTINKIESGALANLTSDNIVKLANALDVTTDTLLKVHTETAYVFNEVEDALDFVIGDEYLTIDSVRLTDLERELLSNAIKSTLDNIRLIRNK